MGKKKILIVDDELEIRNLLSTFFIKKGFEVVALESGVLGLNILAKEDFCALISDIKMPYMNGVEFARRARKLNPDLTIILLTGYGSLETAQEAIKIGIHDYLTKPVDLEKLKASVEEGLKKVAEKKQDLEYYLKLEKELEKDKENLDSMKEELMSLISHELRTPVTLISESFSLLKDLGGIPSDKEIKALNEDQKKVVFSGIDKGRRRLINAMNNIDYYMKLSKENVKLNKSRINLEEFLEKNFDGFRHMVSMNKARLKKDFGKNNWIVDIDKEKFIDLLARLINNATNHNPEGVEITLKVSTSKDNEKDFVKIEVCDNGQGIKKERLENIFSPFSVGDIVHHGKGIGLSLSICKKVIELHGGKIKVDSEKEKGTTVKIEIPRISK